MAKSRTILIWHNNGEQQFTFTVNPERLRVSRPNCNRVERLAMGGTVNLWGGRGLREVSFTTFLPEERSPFYGGTDGAVQSAGKTARADERVLPKTRTVKRGDTLWGIACELYGDGTRWREIAKKNGVTEPRKLPVGKVLVL